MVRTTAKRPDGAAAGRTGLRSRGVVESIVRQFMVSPLTLGTLCRTPGL